MRVLPRPVLVPELGLVVVKPGRESVPVFHNTRVLVEPEPKSMRSLPSGSFLPLLAAGEEIDIAAVFGGNARVIHVLLAVLVHCLTGCCAMSNPASGHMAIIITAKPSFTVMVPAQWCCAGTATAGLRDQTSRSHQATRSSKPVSMDD